MDLNNHYNQDEAMAVSSIKHLKYWREVRIEENIPAYKIMNKNFFLKSDIEQLIYRQKQILDNYYNIFQVEDAIKKHDLKIRRDAIPQVESIRRINTPFLVKCLMPSRTYKLYLKEDVDNYISNYSTKQLFKNVSLETSFETFMYRTALKNLKFTEKAADTEKLWFDYVNLKLNSAKRAQEDDLINCLVYSTERLSLFCQNDEIYHKSSKDIDMFLTTLSNMHAQCVYYFLNILYNDIFEKKGIKIYRIQDIKNPSDAVKRTGVDEICTIDDYLAYHNFVKKFKEHKKRALESISSSKSNNYYASTWLYILIHLTNAWRHGDVVNFPRVDLRDTSIQSLEWLENNEITQQDALRILNQIIYSGSLYVSKTKVKNYFFFSNDLALAYANAIAICELYTQQKNPLSKTVMDLGTKQNKLSKTASKVFFKDFQLGNEFRSRKMNKTLITFMHLIAEQKGDGAISIELAKALRRHRDSETTNIYINIPQEHLDFLTEQLFARGHFGYIPGLLAELITGKSESIKNDYSPILAKMNRTELIMDIKIRTQEIKIIEESFGTINKIQATAGFLNSIQHDKLIIEEKFMDMSLEELLILMHKIGSEQLPSKSENVQCLFSETGCVKKGMNISCVDCQFSIPNYYTLSTLAISVLDIITEFNQRMTCTENIAEKVHLANLFHARNQLLKEACKKFGIESVFQFLGMSFAKYKEIMQAISSVKNLQTIKKIGV